MRNISLLLILICSSLAGVSQDTLYFKKGLIVMAGGRYGREALYTDPFAYKFYTNTVKTPVQGDTLMVNDRAQALNWQAIEADSSNRFRGRGFAQGYLYLTHQSAKERIALLNIRGNAGFFFNGEPHAGDPYASGYLYIPVKLKKGVNELYVRGGGQTVAKLIFPKKPVFLNTEDPTLPHILLYEPKQHLKGAVVLINSSSKELKDLSIKSSVAGKEIVTPLPPIPAMSSRKVIFSFNAEAVTTKQRVNCNLSLLHKNKLVDETSVKLESMEKGEKFSSTFVSEMDGSLQYYAVTPQVNGPLAGASLFFSVHGAGVEAIGQARAYKPKAWGTLVAPTNRRPRGFNWEDWGRLDALEVLDIVKERFKPDPQHIYLTGHSMGGHGTWFLGATYPGIWAGIAPCAGYPTLKGYGSADGAIPDSSKIPIEQILLRSSNQSDVVKYANNYKASGVYIFHGDEDRTVSVNYARQMRQLLGGFHQDMSYYEYPGGSHWFGDHSVDWGPLFDFFKWHSRLPDSMVNKVDFTTSNPGVSAEYRWISVYQQLHPLQYSRIRVDRNISAATIRGSTENVKTIKIKFSDFAAGKNIRIALDGHEISYSTKSAADSIFLGLQNDQWVLIPAPALTQKGPHRYGTFKDSFRNRMVFVYGTTGTKEENEWSFNKARYDAETWYYRGNGAVDIVPDKEFSADRYAGRGIIIFGNANTNAVYNSLLSDCPVQVARNSVKAGNKTLTGDGLAAYFVWPLKNSSIASVAVIAGTGIRGMKAANANQYFAGASGFPDFMVFDIEMLNKGTAGIKIAGFFDNDWKIDEQEMIVQD
jgi:predicted esterase